MRNFSKTLTLMGLLAPVGANALGVGEIKLHSALNQVLEAEIPLITSGSESSSEIRVSLASPAAFVKAGIERPYYLSRLRFTPVVKNGGVVIKISSKEVIREPFLNFLIEVNWPSGHMLREFTVLLDPPGTFNEPAITATRTPTIQSETVTSPRYPVDQPANYGFPAKSPAPRKKAARTYQSGDFVTSRRNDSLWSMANRVKTEPPVSKEQMMIALYEANPHAFFKKNMNALKAGQRLRIPAREAIVKTDRQEALAELGRQNDEWRGRTATVADQPKDSPVSKSNEAVAKNVSSGPESKLKLVSPAVGETAKTSSDSTQGAATGKTELQTEMLETIRQENDELRSRLKEAEEQLARINLLLTLKDKQLSALQNQKASGVNPDEKIIDLDATKPGTGDVKPESQRPVAAPAEQTQPPAAAVSKPDTPFTVISEENPSAEASLTPPANPENPSVASVEQPDATAADQQPVGAEQQPESVAEVQQPESASMDQKPQSGAADETGTPVQSKATEVIPEPVASEPVQKAAPAEPAKIAATTSQAEDDLLSEFIAEPYYLAAGGSAVMLLALLGLALARRRARIILAADTESVLASANTARETAKENTDLKTVQPVQSKPVGVVESSFLSEFTPSDFDALETDHDDVDPVSEADVYLAYGRYQQAEDLIRNAIENYPERDECKLKLLEIHFATEDRDAFEAYARELEPFKKDKPEFWAKVAEMGREICPNSPLFGPVAKGGQTNGPADFGKADFSDEASGGFDLGDTEFRDGESDFDHDALGFEMAESFDHSDEFDEFASDTGSDFVTESVDYSERNSADDHSIEFKRFDVGDSIETGRQTDFSGKASAGELDEDRETYELVDMNFEDSSETPYEAVSDHVSELADLTDGDEIETKLDLAKAYVDLDDEESARGILSQILIEGNEEQKSEAQALVDVLENKA